MYEIDLTDAEQRKLRDALAIYVAEARKASAGRGRRRTARGPSGATGGSEASTVRAWARENGYDVPDRGRIPTTVRDAYTAAH